MSRILRRVRGGAASCRLAMLVLCGLISGAPLAGARADDDTSSQTPSKIVGVRSALLDLFGSDQADFDCTMDTAALSGKERRDVPAAERCDPKKVELLRSGLVSGGLPVLAESPKGLVQIELGGQTHWIDSASVRLAVTPRVGSGSNCRRVARIRVQGQAQQVARGAGEDPCASEEGSDKKMKKRGQ